MKTIPSVFEGSNCNKFNHVWRCTIPEDSECGILLNDKSKDRYNSKANYAFLSQHIVGLYGKWYNVYNGQECNQPIIPEVKKTQVLIRPTKKNFDTEVLNQIPFDNPLKKKPLLAYLRDKFPNEKGDRIRRSVQRLMSKRAIEIDRTYKTKPFVIQGKAFNYFGG